MDRNSIIIGLLIGCILAYLIFYLLHKAKSVSLKEHQALTTQHQESITQLQVQKATLETKLSSSEQLIYEYTERVKSEAEINKAQQAEINAHKQKISELNANNSSILTNLTKQNEVNDRQSIEITTLGKQLTDLTAQISKLSENNSFLHEKLSTQKEEQAEMHRTAHLQFEKIANKLFEEKSSKFTETNKTNIETLLNPLKEDINLFKTKVEETYDKESKQRFSLEEKVKELIEQTNKVSSEANNLATALKGKPQKRGNWGEMILERILESSGLTKDREYFVQHAMKDEAGNQLRPDIKVILPDQRIIIIDSKVSLVAYDKFSAADDIEEQAAALEEHVKSTYTHIDQLSGKKYDDLEAALDFTMMFVPIEPAYLLAIQHDQDLWAYAYAKRVLLVSPTNLIACLKLISDLWRREMQSKNALEIVKKGEALYEKFVGFTKTFEEIGNSIKNSQDKYDKALGQLNSGRGNLVNQAIQLKNLGLKSDKQISLNMLPLNLDESDAGIE